MSQVATLKSQLSSYSSTVGVGIGHFTQVPNSSSISRLIAANIPQALAGKCDAKAPCALRHPFRPFREHLRLRGGARSIVGADDVGSQWLCDAFDRERLIS